MHPTLLAVIGPWQMLIILLVLAIPVFIIILMVRSADHRRRIEQLEDIIRKQAQKPKAE